MYTWSIPLPCFKTQLPGSLQVSDRTERPFSFSRSRIVTRTTHKEPDYQKPTDLTALTLNHSTIAISLQSTVKSLKY